MPKNTTIGHIEIDASKFDAIVNPECLPVLPTRNLVLFPDMVFPISIVRKSSRDIARQAYEQGVAIGVFCQNNPHVENPLISDLFDYGVVAQVLKVLPLPDDSAIAIVRTREKVRLAGSAPTDVHPIQEAVTVSVESVHDPRPRQSAEVDTMLENCRKLLREMASVGGQNMAVYDAQAEQNAGMDVVMEVNTMCTNAPIPTEDRRELLAARGVRKRLERLFEFLTIQKENHNIAAKIEERAREKMSERARHQFLETQMQEIRSELYGDDSDDFVELRETIETLAVDDATRSLLMKELGKLEKLNPQSPDYQTQYAYLKTVTELPWGKLSTDSNDFTAAETKLNATHFGMEKVKERVLEQLAMMIHSPQSHSPIICLVGPPGVGKTSLGKSIADAMGRQFQRVSFGGLHDESEIRGHRRTYIGAMPGRIIEAIRRAGTMNPVIMLDEIDKIGADYKGDPAAALLEVLDPEQNVKFHDNYIDIDFDLSKVMFITTANTLSTVSSPLLDRMEIIDLSGYSAEEKREIALTHLLPTLREEMGLEAGECEIAPAAIDTIISDYTAESGVRRLQKQLASILRKYVRAKVAGTDFPLPVEPERLRDLLGVAPMSRDRYGTGGMPGVVTGLAWTAAGGEILFIETVLTAGKGQSALTLTGNLGDVMKESATLAHRYALAHAEELGISAEMIGRDVHIHVPEGAIPKDGPSAGITMTTAIVSAMTGRPVRPNVAMTGEMTLRGKVLPVGGIKEKILAAKRAGVKEIIMCAENRRNVEDVNPAYIEGLTFHYVTGVDEVLRIALEPNA